MENATIVVNITTSTHLSPPTPSQTATIDLAYILAALSFTIVLLRTLIRPLNHEKYQVDDFVMLASLVLLAAVTATYPLAILNGNNVDIAEPLALTREEINRVVLGSKFVLLNRPLYLSYIWIMKACLLIYFTRLTSYRKEVWVIYGTGFVLGLTWLVCMLIFFLECQPLHWFWMVAEEVPECARALDAVVVTAITDLSTTLIVMAIPIPIILRHRIPTRTTLFIGFEYLVGTFILLIPIIRIVSTLEDSQDGSLIWRELECFIADLDSPETIAANGPIIHGLHRHAWAHISQAKFGRNSCNAPDFRFAVDHVETQPLDGDNAERNARRSRVRNSIKEFTGRLRGSTSKRLGEIQATVVLMQESKTGKLDPNQGAQGPAGLDIFMGGGHGRGPIGHVSTEVFSDSPKTSKRSTFIERHIRGKTREPTPRLDE